MTTTCVALLAPLTSAFTFALSLLLALPVSTRAQEMVLQLATANVTRHSGGSVKIKRGGGAVSARSSLELSWYIVNNPALGIVFDGAVGAKGKHDGGWYYYEADMKVHALEDILAFEVIVLAFNVWNEHERTLVFSQLEDLKPNQYKEFSRRWGPYRESDLRSHRTSVVYVAKVMKADGTVLIADDGPALAAARLIEETFKVEDLAPSFDELLVGGG